MSDEPTPELRALAEMLFAAGRTERPGPALGRRLSLIEPQLAGQRAPSQQQEVTGSEPRAVRRAPSRRALWLAAAALLASGAGLWLASEQDAHQIRISPDRLPPRASSVARERAEVSAAGSAEHRAARGAAPARPRPVQRRAPVRTGLAPEPHAAGSTAPTAAVPPSPPPPTAPPPTAQPPTLLAELELLKRARAALRSGAGEQALELLERHALERTGNDLEAEATLLRIEALSLLGRHGEASRLAARFVRANPNNALGDRAKSFIRATEPRAP